MSERVRTTTTIFLDGTENIGTHVTELTDGIALSVFINNRTVLSIHAPAGQLRSLIESLLLAVARAEADANVRVDDEMRDEAR